jgi:hypothetical protein
MLDFLEDKHVVVSVNTSGLEVRAEGVLLAIGSSGDWAVENSWFNWARVRKIVLHANSEEPDPIIYLVGG